MKITNNLNLPTQLVKALEREYQYKDKRYSITSLLQSPRELQLKRRYNEHVDMSMDVSDGIWLLLGNGTHRALEEIELEPHQKAEQKLSAKFIVNGFYYTLSGIVDYIDTKMPTVDDYKTCTAYAIIYKSNDVKWKKQLQYSAYLHWRETGQWISKGRIIAIVKDWKKSGTLQSKNYPKLPVIVIEYDLGDVRDVENELQGKFNVIYQLEQIEDDKLPMCTLEERFNNGDKYAVKKVKSKRATKIHDTLESAKQHVTNLNKKNEDFFEIEVRKGEDKKCHSYCSVNKFCEYYKKNYGG